MAILSSHTLNSVDGTHAGGIQVSITKIKADGGRQLLINSVTDEGGRLQEIIPLSKIDTQATFEMVLQTGEFFAYQDLPQVGMQILNEIVVRFEMPDAEGLYHIPLMIAPNSYSVWWSS